MTRKLSSQMLNSGAGTLPMGWTGMVTSTPDHHNGWIILSSGGTTISLCRLRGRVRLGSSKKNQYPSFQDSIQNRLHSCQISKLKENRTPPRMISYRRFKVRENGNVVSVSYPLWRRALRPSSHRCHRLMTRTNQYVFTKKTNAIQPYQH